MVENLRETGVSQERPKVHRSISVERRFADDECRDTEHQAHFNVEDASHIVYRSGKHRVRSQEERGDIGWADSQYIFAQRQKTDRQPRRQRAEDEKKRVGSERYRERFGYPSGFEKSIRAERHCRQNDFRPDAVGDTDIGRVAEQGEETLQESAQSVEFIKTPKGMCPENKLVDNGGKQDDQKAEQKNIGRCRKIGGSGESHERQEQQKRTQKKKECMREFEKEKNQRAHFKRPK